MKRGSITIFLSLLLSVLLILNLALLESARVSGLRFMKKQAGETAAASVEAGYIRQLFDQYGLLFYDGGMGSGWLDTDAVEAEFERYFRGNLTTGLTLNGKSFFGVGTVDVQAAQAVTATDYNGAVFMNNALAYFPYDAAGKLLQEIAGYLELLGKGDEAKAANDAQEQERKSTNWSEYGDSSNSDLSARRNAGRWSITNTRNPGFFPADPENPGGGGCPGGGGPGGGGSSGGGGSAGEESGRKPGRELPEIPKPADKDEEEPPNKYDQSRYQKEVENSPIGYADQVKAKGWLALVMPKGRSASVYTMDQSASPSKTMVDTRKAEDDPADSLLKRVAFNEYLMLEFSCFTDDKKTDVTQYELEYLLYGKSKDEDNLMKVLDRLMWIREGMNLLYLIQCPEKMEEVNALSMLLAGWTEIPALIALTEAALAAAWAYAEALLDVRTLLSGERCPIVKTDENWRLGIDNIGDFLRGSAEIPKSKGEGLTYREYLRLLLYWTDPPTLSYRAMDLIQTEMQKFDPAFRMAAAVSEMTFYVTSSSSSLFSRIPLLRGSEAFYFNVYTWTDRFTFSYQ